MNSRVLKIGILTAVFSASCAGAATAGSLVQPDPEDVVSALETAKTSADTLPGFVPAGTKGLGTFTPGAERKLTTSDGVDLWVTTTEAGDVCLIGATKDGYSGQTCATPREVAKAGLPLQFVSPSGAIEAYLLPDAATISTLPSGAEEVNPSLVLTDPYAPATAGNDFGSVTTTDLPPSLVPDPN